MLAFQQPPAPAEKRWRPYCASVIDATGTPLTSATVCERIIAEATRLGVTGIITLSEFSVESVALAAVKLGLPGAGPHAARARDKRLMRETWAQAGVPQPRFRPVRSEAELRAACRELTPPLLLKAAWGSGSVGQVVITGEADVTPAWAAATSTVTAAHQSGFMRLQQPGAAGDFLVEEIIDSSTASWWPDGSGYGDYLSVEGIVARGVYHPLCITSRIPTIPPFTELSNLAPCVLPERLQRKAESVARAAIDALELGDCGTHTELKLMAGEGLAVLETAARLGGVMVAPEIEHVYGFDAIGELTEVLLGNEPSFPARMFTGADASGAAGSLSLIAANAAGEPWREALTWDPDAVDWDTLLSPGSRIDVVPGLSISAGTVMPAYDTAGGAWGYGGIFFVRAKDAATLVGDCYSVLNGLEGALRRGLAGQLPREGGQY